jgi:hypothetical protein
MNTSDETIFLVEVINANVDYDSRQNIAKVLTERADNVLTAYLQSGIPHKTTAEDKFFMGRITEAREFISLFTSDLTSLKQQYAEQKAISEQMAESRSLI